MTEFVKEINSRIATARLDLAEAEQGGDDYLAQIRRSELETLSRLAAENGVSVEHG